MKDKIYGKRFRHIRRLKHITLISASQGLISKSSLSRWEKGKDNLSWCTVLDLLNKNNIKLVEFAKNNVFSDLDLYVEKIQTAFYKNQSCFLETSFKNSLETYNLDPSNTNQLFKTAIVCNYYKKCTDKNIFPKIMQYKIKIYFSNIIEDQNYWSYDNVFFLCHTLSLLDGKSIFKFSCNLIDYVQENQMEENSWYRLILNCLLEAAYTLAGMNIRYSKILLNKIDGLEISDFDTLEKIKIKHLDCVIQSIESNSSVQMKSLYDLLDFLGMNYLKIYLKRNARQIYQLGRTKKISSQIWEN